VKRRIVLAAAGVVVLLLAAAIGYALYRKHEGRNIRGSPTVEFTRKEPKAAKEPKDIVWPMYGFDAARSRAPVEFKVRPPFRRTPVWTFHAGGLLEFPPSIGYGKIFIANNPGTVFAIDERTGKRLWLHREHRCTAASPAIGKHLVFISMLNKLPCNASHGEDGLILALDAETGKVVWRQKIGPSESSPLFAGDLVVVGDWAHNVSAFTSTTGTLRWRFHSGGEVKGGVALAGGRIYFGSYDTHVYALALHTGKQVWRASSQPRLGRTGTFYANPAVAYARIYIGATDGKMYSYGARSGKLRWSNGTGDWIYSSAAIWRGNVLVGSYDGDFYSFDAATGDVHWKFSADGKISGSPTVIDGIVYFSTLNGKTYGLDARTGKVVWRYPGGQYANVVASKTRLYLVGYSRLYALIPRGGERVKTKRSGGKG
jgi:outer membrane protein assembly factor BamB